MAAKTTSKTQKTKPRSRVKASATQRPTYAELRQQLSESLEREKAALKDLQVRDQQFAESLQREKATAEELEDCKRQLAEVLEQQTATSEILQVIASSPTELEPVLNVVVENAARLCDSIDAQLRLVHEGVLRLAASYGSLSVPPHTIIPISRQTASGRAVADQQMIHIRDLELERETEYPKAPNDGSRTILGMPLLRQGSPIGCIFIRRLEVRPFTDKQIALSKRSPTKRSSRSKTSGCSRKSRSAMRNCAKPWSTKLQRPRCSALSVARPQTCSRCLMPSSRAPRGFVGSSI